MMFGESCFLICLKVKTTAAWVFLMLVTCFRGLLITLRNVFSCHWSPYGVKYAHSATDLLTVVRDRVVSYHMHALNIKVFWQGWSVITCLMLLELWLFKCQRSLSSFGPLLVLFKSLGVMEFPVRFFLFSYVIFSFFGSNRWLRLILDGSFCKITLVMLVCLRVLFFIPFHFQLHINDLVRKI